MPRQFPALLKALGWRHLRIAYPGWSKVTSVESERRDREHPLPRGLGCCRVPEVWNRPKQVELCLRHDNGTVPSSGTGVRRIEALS